MCGIVGYIGQKNIKEILINGLSELEYRGYDSAGIAIMQESNLSLYKSIGKLNNLKVKIKDLNTNSDILRVGIGHTRWATHGKPTELNAHPHSGEFSFVIHNGIIENYKEIKEKLEKNGHKFISQTDTEVIAHLFEYNLEKQTDALKAFKATIDELEGAYAILLITKSESNKIFFAKNGSPLIIGYAKDEIYFGSSDAPLIGLANEVTYFNDNEFGVVSINNIEIYNKKFEKIDIIKKPLSINKQFAQKGGFRFFMEKEIYEQSSVISETIMGRIKNDRVEFEELEPKIFNNIENITICACGTSFHAGLASSYLFERISKVPTKVEVASEFRYKEPLLNKNTLFIVISQSGETADTLEALKMAKEAGLKTLIICNVDNSSMVRLADFTILTRAGIEKGVASTKAFATQMVVLWMLSLYIANIKKTISKEFMQSELKAILSIPSILKVNDNLHEKLRRLSKRYLHGHGFFFIGRDIFYPLALEGALKLKEISYLHAEGYPAGEMKHGPIALADSELFTIALMPKNMLYEKMKSNVEELSARDSTILAISFDEFEIADDFIKITEQNHYMFEFFEMMVVLQLLSMEIAIRLGNDVDMPRNLAKSVTVE